MNRVLGAARMQLTRPLGSVGFPWVIVASSFAINLAIWKVGDIAQQAPGGSTGGLAALYITVAGVFVQAVTQMFPFAMGLSLSRRDFYLGTALIAVVQSVAYGFALTVLAAIEDSTTGWVIALHFWAPGALNVGNPALQFVVFTVPMLACAFLGMGIGVVFKRWGAPGLYGLIIAVLLVGGLIAVWATWQESWGDIWAWLAKQSVTSLTVMFPAVITLALAALTFAGLRRTVP